MRAELIIMTGSATITGILAETWRLSAEELIISNCGAAEDSWESHEQQGDQNCQS